MIPDKLLQKAWQKIESLKVGQSLTQNEVKNWDVFVDCCKLYIQSEKRGKFNPSYTQFTQTLTFRETIEKFITLSKLETEDNGTKPRQT